MLKAVIFDMDGVLIDSEPMHAKATVLALKKLDAKVPLEYCYTFIGSTTIHMLESIIEDFHLQNTPAQLEACYNQAKYELIEKEGYDAVPYTKELIQDLYANGMKLAIASSSTEKEIAEVTKALDITRYFHKLVSGTTVSRPKPAPDVFLKAVKELEVTPEECIIIEDSCNGVRAATAAGIPVIGFINEHSGNQDLSNACVLIEGFEEVDYKFINNAYLRALNLPVTVAQTERLVIRELSADDIPTLHRICRHLKTADYTDDIVESLETEIEKHKAYIENVYRFYGYGLWGVFLKDTGALIGRCGIQNTLVNGNDEIELGYLIDEDYQEKGYAKEAVDAILRVAFHELSIKKIVAVIHPSNMKSLLFAEKISMNKTGKIIRNGQDYYLYHIENPKMY